MKVLRTSLVLASVLFVAFVLLGAGFALTHSPSDLELTSGYLILCRGPGFSIDPEFGWALYQAAILDKDDLDVLHRSTVLLRHDPNRSIALYCGLSGCVAYRGMFGDIKIHNDRNNEDLRLIDESPTDVSAFCLSEGGLAWKSGGAIRYLQTSDGAERSFDIGCRSLVGCNESEALVSKRKNGRDALVTLSLSNGSETTVWSDEGSLVPMSADWTKRRALFLNGKGQLLSIDSDGRVSEVPESPSIVVGNYLLEHAPNGQLTISDFETHTPIQRVYIPGQLVMAVEIR